MAGFFLDVYLFLLLSPANGQVNICSPSGTKQRGFSAPPSRSLPTMHKLYHYLLSIEVHTCILELIHFLRNAIGFLLSRKIFFRATYARLRGGKW